VTISFWGGGGGGGRSNNISNDFFESASGSQVICPPSSGGGGSGGAVVNYPVRPGSVVEITKEGYGGSISMSSASTANGENGMDTCVSFEAGFGTGQTYMCEVCAQGGGGGGTYIGGGVSIVTGTCPNIHDIQPVASPAASGQGIMPYTHAGSSGGCFIDQKGGSWNQPCISVVGCIEQEPQTVFFNTGYAIGPGGSGPYELPSQNEDFPDLYSGRGGKGIGCTNALSQTHLCPTPEPGGEGALLIVYSLRETLPPSPIPPTTTTPIPSPSFTPISFPSSTPSATPFLCLANKVKR
jgi:hypothetical protein